MRFQDILPWDFLDVLSRDRGRGHVALGDDLGVERDDSAILGLDCELALHGAVYVRGDAWNGPTHSAWNGMKNNEKIIEMTIQ